MSRWWWPVFSNFTPAGATPIPLRPNSIVTGLFTVAPSFGLMMYASAPAGDGVRSWAQARVATDAMATAAMATARMFVLRGFLIGGAVFSLCQRRERKQSAPLGRSQREQAVQARGNRE